MSFSQIYIFASRWLFSTNHKDIGILYLIFGGLSGILGTTLYILIQMELIQLGYKLLLGNPQSSHVWFTGQLEFMFVFMVLPVFFFGFGNFFVPRMIGARGMAFPRINNITFWLLPPSIIVFLFSILWDAGAGTGWTVYPPLSSVLAHSGPFVTSSDIACFSLNIVFFVQSLGAINFITTILNMRAPGMTMRRMPLFVWFVLITSILLILPFSVWVVDLKYIAAGII